MLVRLGWSFVLLVTLAPVFAQAVEPVTPPPHFLHLEPYLTQTPVRARVGRAVRFAVQAQDPSGMPLTYSARALPPGAEFNPETQTFTWTPPEKLEGTFSPIFIATNGKTEAVLMVQIAVTQNRAPKMGGAQLEFYVGERGSQSLAWSTSDADNDALSFTCDPLPKSAELDRATGTILWQPTAEDIGRYAVTCTASDGELSDSETYTLVAKQNSEEAGRPNEEWKSFLQPGVGYSLYLPRDGDRYGTFQGVDLQLSIITWIHRNDNRGPSHGRVYVSGQILQSQRDDIGTLFIYSLGMTLSLERNPTRRWLIPHYGVELGGITQEQMGGRFQTLPFAGVHVWASRNLFVNAAAGYLLVPADMDDLSGFVARANLEFSLW